ncbi:MAG: ATPase, partial [Bacteroidetes bacterium]
MEFIDREKELESLNRIRELSQQRSMMTFIVGRRRIGKTRLIRESVKGVKYLYFFVSRKEE